ncbi:rhamnogalacturonan acetylesterase [Plebeiibacterium sediminum]|uniref:Rhamnogalacturonan acetylesterase n=1 Tax=Plebeiibacterium sediminum TaxID=2992112 RepID=A0AAE3SDY9_9BACT|nr:rhamnogalacturonan acetylesterase [Plebeiobacterium sediminum]MCW3785596.1 rhamnogalacturonan acetylesterase [Plebeiobacterium sediminum]
MNKLIVFMLFVMGFVACTTKPEPIDIFMIGDSTMANKIPEVYPETGWGQVLPLYFDTLTTIHNHAVNGRSSKSFIGEGRWQVVLDSLKAGDYLLIQFGHNDQKIKSPDRYTEPYGEYTDNLKKYINESRAKGAKPILLTSIVRRKFNEDGTLVDTHTDYPPAMRKVAEEMNVPLIDLQAMTANLVESLGDEASKQLYLWDPNTSERFPEGRKDDTHLCVEGAKKVAGLAVKGLSEKDEVLSAHIIKNH